MVNNPPGTFIGEQLSKYEQVLILEENLQNLWTEPENLWTDRAYLSSDKRLSGHNDDVLHCSVTRIFQICFISCDTRWSCWGRLHLESFRFFSDIDWWSPKSLGDQILKSLSRLSRWSYYRKFRNPKVYQTASSTSSTVLIHHSSSLLSPQFTFKSISTSHHESIQTWPAARREDRQPDRTQWPECRSYQHRQATMGPVELWGSSQALLQRHKSAKSALLDRGAEQVERHRHQIPVGRLTEINVRQCPMDWLSSQLQWQVVTDVVWRSLIATKSN